MLPGLTSRERGRRGVRRLVAGLLAVAITGLSAVAHAQETPLQRIEREVAADSTNPTLRFVLAAYRGRAGDRAGCLAELARTRTLGKGFLPTADAFPALEKDACWDSVRASFAADLPRVVTGTVWARIPDRELLPEGIAWDPVRDAWYVGSVPRGAIYRLHPGGRIEPFSKPADSLDVVLGLAVDAKARRLVAVSMAAWTAKQLESPRNHLVVYDLDRGVVTHRVPVREARGLNDVAILPGGDALVSDSRGGGLWRVSLATGAVTAVVPLGEARGANGVAVSPDGRAAYVAGSRGVLRVDLGTLERALLPLPARESVMAIDGLCWHEGSLLGIQNTSTPARVVRMRLDRAGAAVTAVETLQSHHHPEFDEPTTGAVAQGAFFVLATTQVSRYGDDGAIADPATLKPPVVLRVPLRR